MPIPGRYRGIKGLLLGAICLLVALLPADVAEAQVLPAGMALSPDHPPLLFAPPADVLTPNKRRNTPYLKVAIRAGGNWSSYSNDRYLDNTALDVGKTSGEDAIYSSAGGFGTSAGAEIEYPLNSVASVLGGVDFVIAHVNNSGPVDQTCVDADGIERAAPASHEFSLTLRYARASASFKLAFTNFYLVGGLAAAVLTSSDLERKRQIQGDNCFFPSPGSSREIVEAGPLPDPVGIHFSYRIGAGRSYQIGERLQFSPEVLIDFGFNRINKSKESDINIYAINAVLRYELR